MGCTPFYGHLMPIRVIAKDLVQRGYDVTFVTSSHYGKAIEDVGCTFVPITGVGTFSTIVN
jgi:UDP:flavonoid glycosyltransferase YjiC (YdhE family)